MTTERGMVGVCGAMTENIPSISTALTTDCTMFGEFAIIYPAVSIYMLKLVESWQIKLPTCYPVIKEKEILYLGSYFQSLDVTEHATPLSPILVTNNSKRLILNRFSTFSRFDLFF